jgi:hypothetical protein
MGWSDTNKRAQLTAPEARLLVVTGKVVHLPTAADTLSRRCCPLHASHSKILGPCTDLHCRRLSLHQGSTCRSNVQHIPAQVDDGTEKQLAYAHFRYEMEGALILHTSA